MKCYDECRQEWNGYRFERVCREVCHNNYNFDYYEYIIIGAAVFAVLAFVASMILLGAMICLRRNVSFRIS